MSDFEDLSKYEYRRRPGEKASLNVGWISSDSGFKTGDTPKMVLDRLQILSNLRVNGTRGINGCSLCNTMIVKNKFDQLLGSAEIRVYGEGEFFSSPDLIVHYIENHRYSPPDIFIRSVLNMDPPGSKEFDDKYLELFSENITYKIEFDFEW